MYTFVYVFVVVYVKLLILSSLLLVTEAFIPLENNHYSRKWPELAGTSAVVSLNNVGASITSV